MTADDPRPAGEAEVMSDLELRSQLYAWLGNRTSKADGDAHDHESLLAASRDLAALVRPAASGGATDGERPVDGGVVAYGAWDPDRYPATVASQADGELRDALADALVASVGSQVPPGLVWNLDKVTDAILTRPAVQRLLANAAVVQRVRALADELDREAATAELASFSTVSANRRAAASRIRAVLRPAVVDDRAEGQ